MGKIAFYKKEIVSFFIFALLISLFYGNTLKNGFVHDDMGQVVENRYIQSLKYFPKVFTGCIWEYALGGCKGRSTYYRPIHSLSYLLTYQVSSTAWFFHLVNLFYFSIAVFLVFVLAKTLTKDFVFSFVAAVIFLIHPANNEVVNWIAAVPELTYVIFILLGTIFFVKYRQTSQNKNLYLVYLFYFLGVLSKEPAVFLPIIFLFIDWAVFKIRAEDLLDFKELKKYFIFLVIFLVYFLMRASVLGGLGQGGNYYGQFTILERIHTLFSLFGRYLLKLFYPYPLEFFYPFQKTADFFNFRFFINLLSILTFCFAFYVFVLKKKNVLSLSLLWIFIFLSPVLLFLNAVGENIFSERYLFASSIGFAFILAYVFSYLWQKGTMARLSLFVVMVVLIITSWIVVYPRNRDWKDSETMYLVSLTQNPDARPIRYNLAVLYRQKGDTERWKEELEEMAGRHQDWIDISRVYNNLGDYYREKKDLEKAIEFYKKAAETSLRNGDYSGYNNLGSVYFERGDYLKALISFCKALQMDPTAEEPTHNFTKIISAIESAETENYILLYRDIVFGDTFKKSEESKIEYEKKSCEGETCSYRFSPKIEETEIIIPSLIMVRSLPSELIKPKKSDFSPATKEIVIEVDSRYEETTNSFIFPTCDGIYYEVEAKP